MKILPPKNILLCNYCYILKLFVSLQMLSAHSGCEAHWGVRSLRAGHYILEGVTLRFVFEQSKLPQSICRTETNAGGDSHGLLYIHIRSVSWGYVYPLDTLYGRLYTLSVDVNSVCSFCKAVVGLDCWTGRCKHPRFYFL